MPEFDLLDPDKITANLKTKRIGKKVLVYDSTSSTNDIAAYMDERLIHETISGTGRIMAWADDPFDADPGEGVDVVEVRLPRGLNDSLPDSTPEGWKGKECEHECCRRTRDEGFFHFRASSLLSFSCVPIPIVRCRG